MLKRILLTTAALSFAAGPAFAADAQPSLNDKPVTTMEQPAADERPDATMDKTGATTDAQAMPETATPRFITDQREDEVRAEQLIGTKVINTQSENVGAIDDLIINKEQGIVAAVISVGGFLGVGEKLVALNANEVEFEQTRDNTLIAMIRLTKADLEAAPSFAIKDGSYLENVQSMLRRHSDGASNSGQ